MERDRWRVPERWPLPGAWFRDVGGPVCGDRRIHRRGCSKGRFRGAERSPEILRILREISGTQGGGVRMPRGGVGRDRWRSGEPSVRGCHEVAEGAGRVEGDRPDPWPRVLDASGRRREGSVEIERALGEGWRWIGGGCRECAGRYPYPGRMLPAASGEGSGGIGGDRVRVGSMDRAASEELARADSAGEAHASRTDVELVHSPVLRLHVTASEAPSAYQPC
jgi:hypothetical protein